MGSFQKQEKLMNQPGPRRNASIDFISLLTARFVSSRTVRKENVLFILLGKGHKCTREEPRVCCYMGTRIAVTYVCTLTSWGKL